MVVPETRPQASDQPEIPEPKTGDSARADPVSPNPTSDASRRDVLKCCIGIAAALPSHSALASAAAGPEPPPTPPSSSQGQAPTPAPHLPATKAPLGSLHRIDAKDVDSEYRSRHLDKLSDRQLIDGTADIISQPGKGMTSFTLHAPLELLARAGLLPLVRPEDRELARMQMVASAAAYEGGVKTLPQPAKITAFKDLTDAGRRLADVFGAGDEDGLEAVVLQMAHQFGTASLVNVLTPALLPTLTSASHAHIGLWLLLRHGASGSSRDASLLRAAARRLASDPTGRLASFDGMDVTGRSPLKATPAQVERDLLERLTHPPKGAHQGRGIRGLLESAEQTGNINRYFGELIRHQWSDPQIDAAFRAVLRVSAHAMLQDDLGQAKFGWSHCLTLPQAACGLSSLNIHRKLGLATTMVWIMAYRTILSQRRLDFDYRPKVVEGASLHEALHSDPDVAAGRFWHGRPDEISEMRALLASEAAVRNDQHLVKYTRACFDMCGFDPQHWRLYMASAAKLCALWIGETPRQKIVDRFLDGRSTPN